MMKAFAIGLVLMGFAVGASAQGKNDPVIMTIDGKPVYKSEFERTFFKNYQKDTVTKADIDEYIDLFVNFKLKVKEAHAQQLDTVPTLQRELAGYRRQLAKPYLIDKEMTEALIKEAYNRTKTEVRASHILISVKENAEPADTLKAYEQAMGIRKRILAGEDFATVAKSKGGSSDPSAAQNGGDLGYFTAFKMVYPFESAAYRLKVGEVSMPVRTQFGYHIIKKTDERPARGEFKGLHIWVSKDNYPGVEGQKRAQEIYEQLNSGADFGELAKKYSDDTRTGRNGGEMPWFGVGKYPLEFEEEVYKISENGQLSEPFQTPYGWHIVRRVDYKDIGSYEELKPKLKQQIQRDSRANKSQESFVNKLKSEYKFKTKAEKYLPLIEAQLDSTIFLGEWKYEPIKKGSKYLFKYADVVVTVDSFATFIEARQRKERTRDVSQYLNDKYKLFVQQSILDYEDSRLEAKHEDFKNLVQEYRDGILIFELIKQEVWDKAQKDSAGLAEFYADNKSKFMWDKRSDATIYRCKNKEVALQVKGLLDKGIERDSIMKVVNASSALNVSTEVGKFEHKDKAILSNLNKGISQIISENGSFYVVNVREILEAEPKKLNEARGLVVAKYQEYLDENWIKSLRAKYPYTINEDVLYSVKMKK